MKEEKEQDLSLAAISSAPEIDYFALENRVRQLMHELLQPQVKRAAEDRQSVRLVQEQIDALSKKTDDIEFVVHKAQRRATLFDEIFGKIAQLEKDLKLSRSKEDQDIQNLKTAVDGVGAAQTRLKEEIRSIEKKNDATTAEVLKFSELMASDKTELMKQIQRTNAALDHSSHELGRKVQTGREEAQRAEQSVKALREELGAVRQQLEGLHAEVMRAENKLDEVAHFKVDETQFRVEVQKFPPRLEQVEYGVGDLNSKLLSTQNYIQKYLPIKIQAMLSDTLHSSLGRRERHRLADFEDKKFKEMHQVVLSDDGEPQLNKVEFHIPEIRRPSRAASRASTLVASDTDFAAAPPPKRKKSSPLTASESKSKKSARIGSAQKSSVRKAITKLLKQDTMTEARPDEEESPSRMQRKKHKSEAKKSYHESEIGEIQAPRSDKLGGGNFGNYSEIAISPRQEFRSEAASSKQMRQKPVLFYEQEQKSDSETLPINIEEDRRSFSGSEAEELAIHLKEAAGAGPSGSGSQEEEVRYDGIPESSEVASGISEISNESHVVRMGLFIKEKLLKYELGHLGKRITETHNQVEQLVEKQLRETGNRVEDKLEAVTSELASLSHDFQEESRRRKREKHDQNLEIAAASARLTGVERTLLEMGDTLLAIAGMVGALTEASQVDAAMTEQDEQDRHSIVLMGHRGVNEHPPAGGEPAQPRSKAKFDKTTTTNLLQRSLPRLNSSSLMRKYSNPSNVISLEGASGPHKPSSQLMSAFKMACLAYNPSAVGYRGKQLDRLSLLRARNRLVTDQWRRLTGVMAIRKPNLKRLWDEALQCSEQVSLSDAATGHPDSSWVSNSFQAKAPTVSPQKVTAKGQRHYILEKTNLLLNPRRAQLQGALESGRGLRFQDISTEVPRVSTGGMRIPAVTGERSTHAHSVADKGRESQWSSSAEHTSFMQGEGHEGKAMQPKFGRA